MGDFERTFGAGADAADVIDELTGRHARHPENGDVPDHRRSVNKGAERRVAAWENEWKLTAIEDRLTTGSMNKVTLIGILGDDPVIPTRGGSVRAELRVATWEGRRNILDGGNYSGIDWHDVTVVEDEAVVEAIGRTYRKGAKVLVEGILKVRDKRGSIGRTGATCEIVVRRHQGFVQLIAPPGADSIPDPSVDDDPFFSAS